MTARYLEDFAVGQTFSSGRLRIDAEQLTTCAAAFDPQPCHLDEAAARDTVFRGLAGQRLAHRRGHHAAPGRERSHTRWRPRWRRL